MSISPLITLTTDYGDSSPYAAVLKGVILSINPMARVLDLSHAIRPQNLRHACYYIASAIPSFPPDTIHVCVVDPGVGTERASILVETGNQRLIGPDNGIFTSVIHRMGVPIVTRRLAESRFWKHPVSDTFHGRDIFAPVAAHLSLGIEPSELGPIHPEIIKLHAHSAVTFGNRCQGEIAFIDDFGNIITNIPAAMVKSLPVKVAIEDRPAHPFRWVRTYADATPGELVCLFSSDGFFEIATVNGSASRQLEVGDGAEVQIEFE